MSEKVKVRSGRLFAPSPLLPQCRTFDGAYRTAASGQKLTADQTCAKMFTSRPNGHAPFFLFRAVFNGKGSISDPPQRFVPLRGA